MKPTNWLCVLITVLICSGGVMAQEGWREKPYSQWTMKDTQALLTDSPWAQTQRYNQAMVGSEQSFDEATVRLRSGLPVRRGLLRLRQLKAKYDQMGDADKKAFDEKNKVLLDCPACGDNYVVELTSGPNSAKGIPVILQTMPEGEMKIDVRLANDTGETRELVFVARPKFKGDEANFFFPRLDSKGQPLIKPTTKKLIVMFGTKIFGGNQVSMSQFEFNVSALTMNGRIEF